MLLLKIGTMSFTTLLASCWAELVTSQNGLTNSFQEWNQRYQLPLKGPTRNQGSGFARAPEIMDISLVVSVAGKIHARNRTSGEVLWTLSLPPESDDLDSLTTTAMPPLVRLDPITNGRSTEVHNPNIAFAVEPQTGVIYELPDPEHGAAFRAQRLAHSVPELVELHVSPVIFPGNDRVYSGRKKVRLLAIDFERGYLEGMTELNSSNGLNERTDHHHLRHRDQPGPEVSRSTTVFVERADYELTIVTRDRHNFPPKNCTQMVYFSIYSSHSGDSTIQADYHRPADGIYIQSLPNGELISFHVPFLEDDSERKQTSSRPLWIENSSDSPIVAIFDLSNSPSRAHPLALLQPTLPLRELLPHSSDELAAGASIFFGHTEDGSPFAMSPEHFPLVAFYHHDGKAQ